MSSRNDPRWVDQLLGQVGWIRRIAGELVAGDLADDLSQEVLALSLRHPPRDRATPRAWLRTVVGNRLRSGFRSDRRREHRERLVEERAAAPDSPEERAARLELQRVLAEEIVTLREPYRETIILRYLEGLSSAEIARSLRVPPGTVRRRLKVGLDRLRLALDERHGGRREGWSCVLVPLGPGRVAGRPRHQGPAAQTPLPAATGRSYRLAAGTAAAVAVVCGALWLRQQRSAADPPPRTHSTAESPRPRAAVFPFATPAGGERPETDRRLEGGAVAGTVRAANGSAVPGAIVTLTSLARQRPHATAATGADGEYAFAGVPEGDFAVTAAAHESGSWASSGRFAVTIDAAARVDLTLSEGAVTLAGRVLDGGGGGVPRATVTAWTSQHPWITERVFEVRADDSGNYRLMLPRGRYLFRALAAGYSRVDSWIDLPGPRRHDLRLHPSARLTGRIIERPTGQPVANALVTALDSEGRPRSATTDASGAFALAIDTGPHHVWARSGPLFGAGQPVMARPAETTTIEIEVRRMPPVAGRLLTSRGQPAAGATVWARPARDAPGFRGVRFSRTSAVENRFRVTTSDAAGHFRFEGLPACAIDLAAEAPDLPPVAARLMETTASDGRWIELRLIDAAVLRGVVVAATGAPAARVRVSTRVAAPAPPGTGAGENVQARFSNAVTDSRGRFELRGLTAGDVWLAAEGQDGDVATSTIVSLGAGEARQIALVLQAPSRISGTVRYPDGQPARGLLIDAVTWRDGVRFGFSASGLSGENGAFTLAPLTAGTVSLQPGWSWYGSSASNTQLVGRQMVTIAAGEHRTDVVLVVPRRTAQITGAVTDAEGRPVTGAAVDLLLEDGRGRAIDFLTRTFTDEGGAFEFSEVPEGAHQIVPSHPAFGQAAAIRVVQGAGRNLILPLPRSGRTPGS